MGMLYSNNDEVNKWLNSTERVNKITKALVESYYCLEQQGDEVVAVFPFGSMNYNCDDEGSDTDIFAIIIPDIDYYVFGRSEKKSYKGTLSNPLGYGDIKLVPINNYIYKLLDMDLQSIEILFTKWNLINPKYYVEMSALLNRKQEYARYNESKYLYNILGAIQATRNHVLGKCDLYEPDSVMQEKQMYQVYRLTMTGMRYCECYDFNTVIVPWVGNQLDEARGWKVKYHLQKRYKDALEFLRENREDDIREVQGSFAKSYEDNKTLKSDDKIELKNLALEMAKTMVATKFYENKEF